MIQYQLNFTLWSNFKYSVSNTPDFSVYINIWSSCGRSGRAYIPSRAGPSKTVITAPRHAIGNLHKSSQQLFKRPGPPTRIQLIWWAFYFTLFNQHRLHRLQSLVIYNMLKTTIMLLRYDSDLSVTTLRHEVQSDLVSSWFPHCRDDHNESCFVSGNDSRKSVK